MKRCLILMVLVSRLSAQESEPAGFPFQEDSYLTYPIENDILFEGQIAPHYPLANVKGKSAGFSLVLTPKVILKMYRTRSNPVKTPSYMPRVTLQAYVKDAGFEVYPYLMLSHHSNGQGGPTFVEDYVPENGGISTASRLNTESGSFSTNFIRTGYFFTLSSFPEHYIGFSYEHHPVHGWWFSIDPLIKDIYGRKRLNYDYKFNGRLLQVEVSHTRILDKPAETQNITCGTLKLRLPMFKNPVWLFGSYYQGQDYYNIYFNENVQKFKMGLSVQTKLLVQ